MLNGRYVSDVNKADFTLKQCTCFNVVGYFSNHSANARKSFLDCFRTLPEQDIGGDDPLLWAGQPAAASESYIGETSLKMLTRILDEGLQFLLFSCVSLLIALLANLRPRNQTLIRSMGP